MSASPPAAAFVRLDPELTLAAPVPEKRWQWRMLFSSFASSITTLIIAFVVMVTVPKLLTWAVVHGVWNGDGAACHNGGACWAFLREKYAFILLGIYPPAERWRPVLMIVLVLALTLWTLPRAHWTRATLIAWLVGTAGAVVLLAGGFFGLAAVPTASWGGLPMTLLLTLLSLSLGFPLAVVLALSRRSQAPVTRYLAIAIIEIVRGLPLVTLLFIASIMLPVLLPEGVTIDKLMRALAALTIFSSVYIAEVIRGGLQAIPQGQVEAAHALGLSWWQTTRHIVLPQAIAKVIPPLTNTVVVIVKNTSLVLVVGLFDLLSTGRAALADPEWPAPFAETYIFIAMIYFIICYGISRYAQHLEATMNRGVRR